LSELMGLVWPVPAAIPTPHLWGSLPATVAAGGSPPRRVFAASNGLRGLQFAYLIVLDLEVLEDVESAAVEHRVLRRSVVPSQP